VPCDIWVGSSVIAVLVDVFGRIVGGFGGEFLPDDFLDVDDAGVAATESLCRR
jgi:hypothetical protein